MKVTPPWLQTPSLTLVVDAQLLSVFSFNLKEMGSGLGAESRLERSKGESRQDNIHLEAGNSLISNNNEGEGHSEAFYCTSLHNIEDVSQISPPFASTSENEETEGSEGQAEYMFGDAELDDDDLYTMEHDNQTGGSRGSAVCRPEPDL